MPPFRAPHITLNRIQERADTFRESYWAGKDVPIDIQEIAEFDLDMDIRAVPDIRDLADVDALLLGDMNTIVVDMGLYLDDRMLNRMRYSVAHEIGHKMLHADIFLNSGIRDVEEWIHWFQSIPDSEYYWIEQHAYEFAGRLLVPPDRLKLEWSRAIEKAEKEGFVSWDSTGDAVPEFVASSICRVFGVSARVIEKRINREGLWPPD